MAKRLKMVIAAALLLPGLALANCYRASAEDGELRFTGSAEGSEFTGTFGEFSVSLCMDGQDLTNAGIKVVVQTASADTGDSTRDSELKGENFFYVEEYPEATWKSSEIVPIDEGFLAQGTLELRGVEKNQQVRLELSDDKPPVLSGSAEILRLDWNVGTGEDFEDTDFIRNRVDLEFELQLQPYSTE